MAEAPSALIDHLFRHHYGRMVAGLTRVLGPAQIHLVEDLVQEALLRALKVWPYQGVPRQPQAWLVQVARNLAIDAARRRQTARSVEEAIRKWAEAAAAGQQGGDAALPEEVADDSLRMIFTCCHPDLGADARVSLTLKTLCGFGTGEIARAFLVREATIAQRLTRARRRLQEGADFTVPGPAEMGRRLDSVLEIIYLMFNEGYTAHAGADLVRRDLVSEALRLCNLLLEQPVTQKPVVHALLSLMYLQGARLPARTDDTGDLLTLARQDRSLWDREWLRRGFRHFESCADGRELTAYHLEAAIAGCHAAAPDYESTDWMRILAYYDELVMLKNSSVVHLNRAVAVAKVRGPDAALNALDLLVDDTTLRNYYLLPATRGQFLWVRGDAAPAAACFREALALGCSEPERQFLLHRLRLCESGAPAQDW